MKKQYIISLFSCLALFGCNDDSADNSNPTPSDKQDCSQNKDCPSEKCLQNGKCARLVDINDHCNEENICKKTLDCLDNICVSSTHNEQNPDDTDACSSDNDCGNHRICIANKCTEVTTLTPGDACSSSDKTSVCPDGLGCFLGKCMTEDEYLNADKCKSNDDCANEDEYKTCLENGLCGILHDLGEECGGNQDLCLNELECISSVCSKLVNENDACAKENSILCMNGLDCIDNICRNVEKDLTKGSECNNSYKLCLDNLICLNNVCIEEKNEDEPCDDKFDLCKSELTCIKNICTPLGKACTTTKDCSEKDSFCCLNDECGQKGFCIPYDDTTKYDTTCRYKTKPGIFEARIQCRWQPDENDHPTSKQVLVAPLVGHFGNANNLPNIVAFPTFISDYLAIDKEDTVVRFIDPETCKTLESFPYPMGKVYGNNPAAADLDGDGIMEIVVINKNAYPTALKWNNDSQKHEVFWVGKAKGGFGNTSYGDGASVVSIFDVNGDSIPEVITGTTVLNGLDGSVLYEDKTNYGWNNYHTSAIGFFDAASSDENINHQATIVNMNRVLRWKKTNDGWDTIATLPSSLLNAAFADFGTPGDTPDAFDFTTLDEKPEIVTSGGNQLNLYALKSKGDGKSYEVQTLMQVKAFKQGGPITIGDFDSDGLPEIGIASSGMFGVYDPRCKAYEAGKCADKNVLWERWSQDHSSGQTGSSLFDFDGDGQAELVYGDECFTRVYDGKTGKVLFSARRTSGTSIEAPVIADADNDGSAEILMGSHLPDNSLYCLSDNPDDNAKVPDGVDPIHEGIRCLDDEDCPTSNNCNKDIGLCTCTSNDDCNTQFIPNTSEILQQYVCTTPIHPSVGMMENPTNASARTMVKKRGSLPDGWTDDSYKVCRASRKNQSIGIADLMIFKDRLDRWVSSRNIWNQHAYNIINIEDNGKVPNTVQWLTNWVAKHTHINIEGTSNKAPLFNNFRLNKQGEYGAGVVPDITGRFIAGSICGETKDHRHVISGKLCNRGTKPVSTQLPASFFYLDESKPNKLGEHICTSYTNAILGVGECDQVGCSVSQEDLEKLAGNDVIMVTNLDEHGFASTIECNAENNTDITHIDSCKNSDPIEIVN